MKKRRPRSLAAALAAFGGKGSAHEPAEGAADPRELPFPPLEYRQIVGPTDKAVFDNPSGDPVWGDLAIGPSHPGRPTNGFSTSAAAAAAMLASCYFSESRPNVTSVLTSMPA